MIISELIFFSVVWEKKKLANTRTYCNMNKVFSTTFSPQWIVHSLINFMANCLHWIPNELPIESSFAILCVCVCIFFIHVHPLATFLLIIGLFRNWFVLLWKQISHQSKIHWNDSLSRFFFCFIEFYFRPKFDKYLCLQFNIKTKKYLKKKTQIFNICKLEQFIQCFSFSFS